MKLYRYKTMSLFVSMLSISAAVNAHPGHSDVAAVHGNGFGVWLEHQLYNVDQLLTLAIMVLVIALTGGRTLFRRRRLRRVDLQLNSGRGRRAVG